MNSEGLSTSEINYLHVWNNHGPSPYEGIVCIIGTIWAISLYRPIAKLYFKKETQGTALFELNCACNVLPVLAKAIQRPVILRT